LTCDRRQARDDTCKDDNRDTVSDTLFGDQLPTNKLNFTLENTLASEQEFKGEGSSSQSNTLTGTIAVTVAQVLANGNLVIRGEKLLTLNQGDEFVRLSGIVRSHDITPENTVLSTQVANARILYSGKGSMTDANANGWLGRFFQSPFFPF